MKQFIIRRLILSFFILIGVSLIMYSIIRLTPGDYISNITNGNPDISEEMIMRMRQLYGLDTNILEGYTKWLLNFIKGDLGVSFLYNKPVTEVIASKMWISFSLALIAFVLQIFIAVPLGIISATKQYTKTDYTITTMALLGISLPSFFFGAVLQRFFAIQLKILPLSGMVNARMAYTGMDLIIDMGVHFILPVTVLTVTGIGGLMRYSRTNMLEVVNSDYIRTARAKGLSEDTVIYRHAFRNTLIPIVTMIGGSIPGLFSGAIITEGMFAISGLGSTILAAISIGDIPYFMGYSMFIAILTLLGTLISDILYAVVDPRIRLS